MRSDNHLQSIRRAGVTAAAAMGMLIAATATGVAGYGPKGIADLLHARGYYNIRIVDIDKDEYEVLACKGKWLYEIEIKRNGRIDDIDREGRCAPRHAYGPRHRDGVNVRAPYTGVHVGKRGVHVRAPFVNLRIPRR